MDEQPLTPAEALVTLFLANTDRSDNAANDELVKQRIRSLAQPPEHP